MKQIKTQDALGTVLAHDHTQIIVGEFKGVRFPKGHIVKNEDIPILLDMGKETLFVYEVESGRLHEDKAALRLRDLTMGSNLRASAPHEGKIELFAECEGLFTVAEEKLFTLNMLEEIVISSISNFAAVKAGEKVAAMRVVPLMIDEARVLEAESLVRPVIFQVCPYRSLKAAIFVTGSEIKNGLVKDTFSPVVIEKLNDFPVEVVRVEEVGDQLETIQKKIAEAVRDEIELIFCTGGMSVDPDDRTPGAIKASASEVITYGSPVFPGAMFMLAYAENGACIMGLPGGVMYANRSILDIVLPRVIARQRLTKADFAEMAIGGLLS